MDIDDKLIRFLNAIWKCYTKKQIITQLRNLQLSDKY